MLRSSVAAPAARKFRWKPALPWFLVLSAALAGCGQKGGLTMPSAAAVPEAVRPVDQPAPPPAEPAGGASAPVR